MLFAASTLSRWFMCYNLNDILSIVSCMTFQDESVQFIIFLHKLKQKQVSCASKFQRKSEQGLSHVR